MTEHPPEQLGGIERDPVIDLAGVEGQGTSGDALDTELDEASLSRSAAAIRAAAGTVIASEVVEDRWVRYTILEESGAEHCVGTRAEPLISRGDLAELRAYRKLKGEMES